ncbi:MAG: sensor histidine kinase [Bacteriovoracaceae bacterium]
MDTAYNIVLLLSIVLSTVVILLAYFYSEKEQQYKYVRVWFSLLCFEIILLVFDLKEFEILALLAFLWPSYEMAHFISSINLKEFKNKEFVSYLLLGGLLSFSLFQLGFTFLYYALPICLFIFSSGLYLLRDFKDVLREKSLFQKISYACLFAFYLFVLLFPFFDSYRIILSSYLHLVLLSFAAITIPRILNVYKKNYELELEQELMRRDQNLINKGKFSELGLMSAGITHEISNPLSIIQIRVEQLIRNQDRLTKEDFIDGLKKIYSNGERISQIIKGIRDYIYLDENFFEEEISARELIDNILVFCGQRLKNHGIHLEIEGFNPIFIRGHRVQLEQALLHLINNSFDAIDLLPEKWIKISASESNQFVEIFFEDSGQGIPMEVARRMMDPFFTTKKNKGTGLGLTLVKKIVEKHGGSFVYKEQAKNTTFILRLPRSRLHRPTPLPEQFPFIH